MSLLINPSRPINWDHELMRGLVSRWKVLPGAGQRGNTLRDLVRGAKKPNDGTFTNGASFAGALGRLGGHGSFNFPTAYPTSSQAQHAHPIALEGCPGFTVAFWARVASGLDYNNGFCGKWDDGGGNQQHFTRYNVGMEWQLRNSANTAEASIKIADASITKSVWSHFCFVADGVNLNAYLNGESAATPVAFSGPYIPTDNVPWKIGFGRSDSCLSKMDDVGYWSRGLTSSNVWDIYQATQLLNDPTLNWIKQKTYSFSSQSSGGTILFGDYSGNLKITTSNQAAKLASASFSDTLNITGTQNFIRILSDSLNGSVVINNSSSSSKTVSLTVSETLNITTTDSATKIADARTSNSINIINTDSGVKITDAKSYPTLFISAAESANKIASGQTSGSLHINESGEVIRIASANTSGTLNINETVGAFRARYTEQTGSLLINGTITNIARLAAASLIDTLVILNTTTAQVVGQTGTIYTANSSGNLTINSLLQAILLRPFNVNSTLLINDTITGQKILKGDSSGSLRITGTENASKISYVRANETLTISGSEDARKVAGGNLSGSLVVNGINTVSKINGLSALLSLELGSSISGTKIVFPQLDNLTIQVSETTNGAIKNIYGQVASNLRISGTEAVSKDIGISFASSLNITSSFNFNAIWNGVLYNIPVRIISEIDATKLSPDRIYILFDASISRDMLLDLVLEQNNIFDAELS